MADHVARARGRHRQALHVRLMPATVLQLALLAAAYFLAGVLGLHVGTVEAGAVTALWIPSGLGLAAVATAGILTLPVIFVGDLFVSLSAGFPLTTALALALATVAEPALGGWLLRRRWRVDLSLGRVRDVLQLLAIAAIAPAASATPGVAILVTTGRVASADAASAWLTWWLADAMAIVLVTSLLLVWSQRRTRTPLRNIVYRPARLFEAAALGLAIVALVAYVFHDSRLRLPFRAFLVFPLLVVAALRFGAHGATAASFLAATVALGALIPAIESVQTAGDDLLVLQAFFGVPAATALVLSAALAERRLALAAVESQRDRLGDLVDQRTSELASLTQALRGRVEQLASTNEELEAFSYSASHDLRAPLRRMDALLQIVTEDEGDRLSPQGREHLARMRLEISRLKTLVDDLLSLARVGSAEPHVSRVDLSALATEVVEELRRESPERDVEVHVQPGIVASADPGLMRIVLVNLLGNAFKYTRPVERARIQVSAERSPAQELVLCVRDNGVGFRPEEAELLFRPFRRLHPERGFEGTGVGLATVQRILARHGGRVWATGEPGHGASFCFSLPAQDTAERATG